jgi:GNAT superfamily N-acetyltransferase
MSHLELQLNSLENRIEFNYSETLDEINTMYRVKPRRNLCRLILRYFIAQMKKQITSEKNLLNLTLNKYRMAFIEEINLCLKDDNGDIVAGINRAICWNWMEISILWVVDNYRSQGYGKRLLEEAEKVPRAKKCTLIKLDTFSFQAPEFYKKYGYELIATIEDAPLGSKHFYYKKDLN